MTQRAIDGFYVYFVTTNTTYRQHFFNMPKKADQFGMLLREICRQENFLLFGYCILPDHVHFLVQKNGHMTLSKMMNLLKGKFSRLMSPGRFWQPRFNFRIVGNDERFVHIVEYIRYNYRKIELPEMYGQSPWVWIDWEAINNLWS